MTREEAIKTLRELWRETNDPWYEEVYNMAIEVLSDHSGEVTEMVKKDLTSDGDLFYRADAVKGWIPVSERLPKARESVILSTKEWTGEGCYWETTKDHVIWKGYRWNATYWDDEVIAWMPLPEPWKGGDDE